METQLEQISEQQKATWNKFSPGWKKWDELTMNFLKPQGDEIIRLLNPKLHDWALDIASGTGEPALTLATYVINGKVVLTDLSEGMLSVAHENAAKRGINNIEIKVCDASHLSFADNSFDSVSCRLGFMFFPDMLLAAKEMYRVLKPGGKIVATVWASPGKNFWATATLNIVNKNMELPKPAPNSPGLYRCAERGLLAGLFHDAGLKKISESEVATTFQFVTIDEYWTFMTDVVAPVVAALSIADDKTKAKIKSEVFEAVLQHCPDGNILLDSAALVISGEK